MDGHDWLAARFEENRGRLRAVAYRILGSEPEAEDAVQETWIRLSRSDTGSIDNLGGWLTTVVGRICLDMLRTRRIRPERPLDIHSPVLADDVPDPELEAVQADSVGLALLVVLETLTPAERLAFVLHDMFAVPFDEIAPILGKSPAAARQLASRARRRVRGTPESFEGDALRQQELVTAFVAASRGGDFQALLELLDPDVVIRADETVRSYGRAAGPVSGAAAVAEVFSGRAQAAKLALIDGLAGLVWSQQGQLKVVMVFTVVDGRITAIDLHGDAEYLRETDVAALEG